MPRDLSESLDAYASVTREFIACMRAVPATAWSVPRAPGKWSPAEESEHITLAQEIFAQQMQGGEGMRVVLTGWRAFAARRIALPWILATGRFPRARSPREARPRGDALSQSELIVRLERAAVAIRVEIERRGRSAFVDRLGHPYFGPMTCAQVLRLTEVHTRHHLVTLSAATSGQRLG